MLPDRCPDLFGEWERELAPEGGPLKSKAAKAWSKKVGQAVVLARLGALTHDLCHVPFGHSSRHRLKCQYTVSHGGKSFGS